MITSRPAGPLTDEQLEDAAWMAETGETFARAAARLKVTPKQLDDWLYKNGRTDIARRLKRDN